ncbi:hypothetical protein [Roseomonas sp. HF4]|uniref:hypothetical protein n=1 Tax=Roseomonas sp. HF4 TaxID=2562313 RepID=UPI001485B587|nr:hypothetical protein [Roseomonas sp. HF4]
MTAIGGAAAIGKAVSALLVASCLLPPLPARAQDAPRAREFVLRGVGAGMTCAAWTEHASARESLFSLRQRTQALEAVAWAIGYLSGAARHGDALDPLRHGDVDQTTAWLDDHCARHPQSMLNAALDAFIAAHPAP